MLHRRVLFYITYTTDRKRIMQSKNGQVCSFIVSALTANIRIIFDFNVTKKQNFSMHFGKSLQQRTGDLAWNVIRVKNFAFHFNFLFSFLNFLDTYFYIFNLGRKSFPVSFSMKMMRFSYLMSMCKEHNVFKIALSLEWAVLIWESFKLQVIENFNKTSLKKSK